jgi:hypothetical protein
MVYPYSRIVCSVAVLVGLSFLGSISVPTSAIGYPLSKSNKTTSDDSSRFGQTSDRSEEPSTAAIKKTPSTASRKQLAPLTPGSHNLSLGIGQIFLTGDLSNAYDNSLGFQAQYTYGVSDLFSFESNFGFSSHSRAPATLSMIHLVTGLRSNLIYFDQLVPFLSAGLGFYRPSYGFSSGANVSGLLFGLNLGTGVDLLISDQFFFGTRLTFHNMFDSTKTDSAAVARNIGGSFMSFMVHVGLSI